MPISGSLTRQCTGMNSGVQGVALYGALVFPKTGRFCCVKWCWLCWFRCPARTDSLEVKKSVDETSLGQVLRSLVRVALFHATSRRTFLTQHPAFEPKFDQIRARVR